MEKNNNSKGAQSENKTNSTLESKNHNSNQQYENYNQVNNQYNNQQYGDYNQSNEQYNNQQYGNYNQSYEQYNNQQYGNYNQSHEQYNNQQYGNYNEQGTQFGNQQYQNNIPYNTNNKPSNKNNKKTLIISSVVASLLILAAAIFMFFNNQTGASSPTGALEGYLNAMQKEDYVKANNYVYYPTKEARKLADDEINKAIKEGGEKKGELSEMVERYKGSKIESIEEKGENGAYAIITIDHGKYDVKNWKSIDLNKIDGRWYITSKNL